MNEVMKWQVDAMTNWWDDQLMKWQIDEMDSLGDE
jgi:hypothetical protein